MFHALFRVGCRLSFALPQFTSAAPVLQQCNRAYTCVLNQNTYQFGSVCATVNKKQSPLLLFEARIPTYDTQIRTVTKFSMRKGKRKTVKAVVKRFFRLHWGGWIRTMAGRHKKMWMKTAKRKHRLKQHVFCNATQSYLLDSMVTKYWRTPKYYVDDPYEPYHTRQEHPIARRKPFK